MTTFPVISIDERLRALFNIATGISGPSFEYAGARKELMDIFNIEDGIEYSIASPKSNIFHIYRTARPTTKYSPDWVGLKDNDVVFFRELVGEYIYRPAE